MSAYMIDEPGYAPVRRALRERLQEWMELTEDPLLTGPVVPPRESR
jgi:hypothetical protein